MINAGIPEAAGRAATHCPELLSRATAPSDLSQDFARLADSFAEHAAPLVAQLCDQRGLTIEVAETGLASVADWFASVGPAHRHTHFSLGKRSLSALLSVPIGELVSQYERILGGTGEIDDDMAELPASAVRFAQQFDDRITQTLSRTIDRGGVSAFASADQIAQVAPFAQDERVWTATLVVSIDKGARSWKFHLAATETTVAELSGTPSTMPTSTNTIGDRGLNGSAIAEVELPLRAVLVDVAMSVARLSSLQPGTVIPVAVNRNVPLLTGDLTIGHGCVGELDDRVALELTQTHLTE